jgi:hypothetical protein
MIILFGDCDGIVGGCEKDLFSFLETRQDKNLKNELKVITLLQHGNSIN